MTLLQPRDWEELATWEQEIPASPTWDMSKGMAFIWRYFSTDYLPNDQLGAVHMLIRECLDRTLPWVATTIAVTAYDQALVNARTQPDSDASPGMVWSHIWRFEGELEGAGHLRPLAEFVRCAAVKWARDSEPDRKAKYCRASAGLFERIDEFRTAASMHRLAATHFQRASNDVEYVDSLISSALASLNAKDSDSALAALLPVKDHPKVQRFAMTHGLRLGGTTVINISNSTIGILNTGEIQDIDSISVNISSLAQGGHVQVADAIKHLTEAVAGTQTLAPPQRADALDILQELSRQAILPADERAKPGVLRAMFDVLTSSLGAAGGVAAVWQTWGSAIKAFFGVGF